LSSGIAVAVFRFTLDHNNAASPRGWGAVMAGTVAGALAGSVLIAIAMRLTRHPGGPVVLLRIVRDALVADVSVTSFGLLAATVLWFQPLALVLMVVPLGVVFIAYRAYSAQHERAAHLEFLY